MAALCVMSITEEKKKKIILELSKILTSLADSAYENMK